MQPHSEEPHNRIQGGNSECGFSAYLRDEWQPPMLDIGAWMEGVGTEWQVPLLEAVAALDDYTIDMVARALLWERMRRLFGDWPGDADVRAMHTEVRYAATRRVPPYILWTPGELS